MMRIVARNLQAKPGMTPPERVGWKSARFYFVMKEPEVPNVRSRHSMEGISV